MPFILYGRESYIYISVILNAWNLSIYHLAVRLKTRHQCIVRDQNKT